MPVTLRDIATKTQLTPSAVSQILNPKLGKCPPFSPETRKRVFEVADHLGYRPNKLAQSMARGRTYTLGLLCGDLQTPYYSELAMAAMMAAEARGYHLLISVTQLNKEREIKCFEMLMQRQVEGILMLTDALQPGNLCYDRVVREKFPVVMPQIRQEGFPSLVSNWQIGFTEAIVYLKHKGHRRIGMVRQKLTDDIVDSKYPVFVQVCETEGIEWKVYDCGTTLDNAKSVGYKIAEDPDRPSAVIAYSDYIATGVIYGLHKNGLAIPRNISIIGIDGTQMGEVYYPPLTTIDIGIWDLAEKAVGFLIKCIEAPDITPENIILSTRLVVRESA